MGPRKRTYFVPGPPVRAGSDRKKREAVPVPVARSVIRLDALPDELVKRNEISKRYNVFSYFDDESRGQVRQHKLGGQQQQQQQQFALTSGQATTELDDDQKRTRNDAMTMHSSQSLSSYVLHHGADLDDSLFGRDGDSTITYRADEQVASSPSRSLSQADLRNVLRLWNVETRSRGSEVGESAMGRELQKLYPSEVLPPTFYGETELSVDAMNAGFSASQELLLGRSVGNADARVDGNSMHSNDTTRLPVFTARCASLAHWQVASNRPDIQMAHFTAINSIMLREGSLLRMVSVVEHMDKLFWKYSVLRLKAQAMGLPIASTTALIRARKGIFKIQDECRVAIAHYRGITVQVMSDIMRWKNLCHQEIQTDDTVEILCDGVNYMQKITNDVCILDHYAVTRLWLAHPPTTFMTPLAPQLVFDASAMELRSNRLNALNVELTMLQAKLELENKDSSSVGSNRSHLNKSIETAAVDPQPDKDQTLISDVKADAQGDGLKAALVLNDKDDNSWQDEPEEKEDDVEEEEEEEKVKGSVEENHQHEQKPEWETLRDFCIGIWGTLLGEPAAAALPDNINPDIVEGYLAGYTEIVPRAQLIPSLPDDLLDTCHKQATAIKKELKLLERLQSKARMSSRLRLLVQQELSSERSLLRQPDLLEPRKHQLLRERQESGGGGSRDRGSKIWSSTENLPSEVFVMTATNSESVLNQPTMTEPSSTPSTRFQLTASASSSAGVSSPEAAFDKSRVQKKTELQLNPKEAIFDIGCDHESAMPRHQVGSASVKFGSFESLFFSHTEGALLPQLDSAKISKQLTLRVVDGRTLVRRGGESGYIKTLRPEAAAKKPVDISKPAWRRKMAIQIQRVIRGFVGRCRAHVKNWERHKHRMATRIQKYWRGIWGRARFSRCLRDFRVQFLSLRKHLNTRDDSALTITHFVRYLGERNVVGPEQAAAKSPLFHKKPPSMGVYAPAILASRQRVKPGSRGGSPFSPARGRKPLLVSDEQIDDMPTLTEAEKEALLKPYRQTYAYRDEANIIKELSIADEKPPKNLLSLLDTRNTSRLLLRPRGRLKPFSVRKREFLNSAPDRQSTLSSAEPRSLAGEPNACYIVPPSLANKEERDRIVALLDSASTVMVEEPTINLRALLRS